MSSSHRSVSGWWKSVGTGRGMCRRFHRRKGLWGSEVFKVVSYCKCDDPVFLGERMVVLFPSLSIFPLGWCLLLSSEMVVSVFFEFCRVLTLLCWRWAASRWLLWWCRPICCLVDCWVLVWIWRGLVLLHLHRLVTCFIICLAPTSVWSEGWVWGCLPNPVGMLFSVERLAEHSLAVHRQKCLVSVLRWIR